MQSSSHSGTSTITVAFGLLGALVAYGIMRLVDTPWFDPTAFHAGVGAAALLGAISAWTVQRLARVPRFVKTRWCLVPFSGAIVGMLVQAVPLRIPITYQVISSGLTKAEPASWILVGAPLGAIPAVAIMILLHLCLRASASANGGGRMPALDARERMIVPAAGTCLVLAAASFGLASPVEIPVVLLIVLLASGALVEVVIRDLLRARWLGRAFQGESSFVIIPMRELPFSGELPAFVGGATTAQDDDRSRAAVVQVYDETAGYRGIARVPIATTCDTEMRALRPLRQRRAVAGAFVGAAAIIGAAFSLFST